MTLFFQNYNTCFVCLYKICHLGVPVHLETPLAAVVNGIGWTLGPEGRALVGALEGDAGRRHFDGQRLLLGRAKEVSGRFLESEDSAVTSA